MQRSPVDADTSAWMLVLPALMAVGIGSMVAFLTGNALLGLAVVGLVSAGALVGWAYRLRRRA